MLSPEEVQKVKDKAYQLGFEYEGKYRGCGQCLVAAVQDAIGIQNDPVFKATTGFAAGIGLMQDSACGGYAGGVLVLGSFMGRVRDNFVDPERIRFRAFEMARKLHDKFIAELGSVNCHGIQLKMFGRSYYLWDQDDLAKFDEAGGHTEKCTHVVGLAAGWTVEILAEEKLI